MAATKSRHTVGAKGEREEYDRSGARTWDEVTAIFNHTHGTKFSKRWISQIGEKALEKIKAAWTEAA